jgi:serine/threonine protein kinase
MGPSPELQAETLLGRVLRRRWTLERVIGAGGTAAVYAATHRNGSRVAIKVLHSDLQADPAIRRRFLQEGYIANRIGVPDVVKVIDDDVEDDIVYLVMELLEGASVEVLRERAGGRLTVADVVEIGCRLLAVLEAGHARGVLHRDIKPANLFRTVDPVGFKVLDFGIASILGARPPDNDGFIGTPAFMAPEQARREEERLDERTDLWAVGATLFTLLTGQYVYPGRSPKDLLRSARDRQARSLREQLSDVPQELVAIVDRALSFEPEARFQSAAEMKLACEECRRSLRASEQSTLFSPRGGWAQSKARAAIDARAVAPAEPAVSRGSTPPESTQDARAGFWSGRVGRLWWFHYSGPCTEEMWRQYLEMVERMIDGGQECTLACLAHRADAPSPVQRKRMAAFIEKNHDGLKRLDRFALVIDSTVHRHAITALSWIVKKPFEERIFNSPLSAIKWLTEKHPALDPEAVRASMASQVPRHSLWPSLQSEEPQTVEHSAADDDR